jgi:endonuclease/exonuclease/phosphatase family metal-dependent hydrolase
MKQAHALLTLAEAAKLPVIACGDRNCPPLSPPYRLLSTHWQDGFESAGNGLGCTYPATFPLWRIDGVWASREFAFSECAVLPPAGSDHRPLRARLQWR